MTTATGTVTLEIPGPPVPYTRMTQGTVRLLRIPEHRRTSQVPAQVQRYLDYKAWVALQAVTAGVECIPAGVPVRLLVEVYKRHWMKRRGDASNYLKGIEDALNTVAFADDKQIVDTRCVIYSGLEPDEDERVMVYITAI